MTGQALGLKSIACFLFLIAVRCATAHNGRNPRNSTNPAASEVNVACLMRTLGGSPAFSGRIGGSPPCLIAIARQAPDAAIEVKP